MYDVNPLGPLMHLKELERQALASHRVPRKVRGSILTPLRVRLASLFRRIHASPGEAASGISANEGRPG
jgi:hypothetical protein